MSKPKGRQILPLCLLVLVVCVQISMAFKRGWVSDYGFINGMLMTFTTPGSIVFLPALGIWYWAAGRSWLK